MRAPTRVDYLLWGALGCALVATAHAEYTLALAAGFNEYVAVAVPGALDLYVIRALQQRRDVFVAVLAMVAANVASHLIAAGVLPVGWEVISAVGAVAPLIVWRVYSLKHTRTRQELLWGVGPGEVSTPEYAPGTELPAEYEPSTGQVLPEYAPSTDVPDTVPTWMDAEYPASTPTVKARICSECARGMHPHVFRPCAVCECTESAPDAPAEYGPTREWVGQVRRSTDSPVPYLRPVPDVLAEVEAEYEQVIGDSVPHPEYLDESDAEYVPRTRAYLTDCTEGNRAPTIQGIKDWCGIGQDRAKRLMRGLGVAK